MLAFAGRIAPASTMAAAVIPVADLGTRVTRWRFWAAGGAG